MMLSRTVMNRLLCISALLVFALPVLTLAQSRPTSDGERPPVILLKLDDVGYYISPRWKRVEEYLKSKNIRASFGIIGQGLEKAGPETVDWIKQIHDEGNIEFWFHGYLLQPPKGPDGKFLQKGEWNESEADQEALLRKVEDLSKEKLGFPLAAFGPHWTHEDENTDKALADTPEIKVWLYGPVHPKYFDRVSIPRIMALENPTFVPSLEKFKAVYEKVGHLQPVLALQGHPDMWVDPARWEGFKQIIDYLQSKNSTFMTPSEYAATLSTTQPSSTTEPAAAKDAK